MMRVYQGTSSAATNYSTEPTITPTCGVNYPITVRLRQDINSNQSRLIMIFFSYKLLDQQTRYFDTSLQKER